MNFKVGDKVRVRKNHVMFGHKGLELAFRADKAVRF